MNFISNTRKDVLNIEFEETLLAERKLHVAYEILRFYDLDDVGYVCTLYCGHIYFLLRAFDLD